MSQAEKQALIELLKLLTHFQRIIPEVKKQLERSLK